MKRPAFWPGVLKYHIFTCICDTCETLFLDSDRILHSRIRSVVSSQDNLHTCSNLLGTGSREFSTPRVHNFEGCSLTLIIYNGEYTVQVGYSGIGTPLNGNSLIRDSGIIIRGLQFSAAVFKNSYLQSIGLGRTVLSSHFDGDSGIITKLLVTIGLLVPSSAVHKVIDSRLLVVRGGNDLGGVAVHVLGSGQGHGVSIAVGLSLNALDEDGSQRGILGSLSSLILVLHTILLDDADTDQHVLVQNGHDLVVGVVLDGGDAGDLELVLIVVAGHNHIVGVGVVLVLVSAVLHQANTHGVLLLGQSTGHLNIIGVLILLRGLISLDAGHQTVVVLGDALQSHYMLGASDQSVDRISSGGLHHQSGGGAVHNSLDLIVVADLAVLHELGVTVGAGKDDGLSTRHVGILHVDHLSHRAIALVLGNNGLSAVLTVNVRYILDTGIDGDVIVGIAVIGVYHHEYGVGVGSDRRTIHGHRGLAILDFQTNIIFLIEGVVERIEIFRIRRVSLRTIDIHIALVIQTIYAVLIDGIRNNVVQQLIDLTFRCVGLSLNHGAVSEDQAGINCGLVAAAVLVTLGTHGQHIGIVIGHGGLVDVGHIAVGVQIGHHVVVHILGDQAVIGVHGLVVVVGGTVHHEVVAISGLMVRAVRTDAGDLAGHLLGGVHILDLLAQIGEGVHDDVVLSEVGGGVLVASGSGAVERGQSDGAVVLIHIQNLGGIIVDDRDVYSAVGAIHIDLSHHAVAGVGIGGVGQINAFILQEALVVVALVVHQSLAGVSHRLTVDGNIPVLVLSGGLADGVVQSLGGYLSGEDVVSLIGKGADLVGLILPVTGGTAELIRIVVLHEILAGQIALVQLLAQLHDIALGVAAGGGGLLCADGAGVSEHRIYYLKDLIDQAVIIRDGQIFKKYNREEFCSLSNEQAHALGLRSLHLDELRTRDAAVPLNPEIMLQAQNLRFAYPNCEPILADVNFQIHRGEIVGIVGHNGVGKSTLAELICGLQKECAGEVFLKGEKAKPKQRIKSTYLVMQDSDYQLFTESVENEIYLGVKEDAELKKRGQNILEQMDLTDHLEKHPASLSGGQKQRLCIAVAYLKDADIICFDEPTSGLDYASMQRVKDLFEKMSADGKTILVISHDYEFILATCTSIMSVQDNRVCDVFSLYEKNRKKLIKSMQVLDAEGGEI